MKQQLRISVLACLLLSFLVFTRTTLSSQSPDIKIQGIVTEIQYDYRGYFLGGQYKLTALISVKLNETFIKPETFTRERDNLVCVSYNYSSPPGCKVNDVVEVYGLWVPILDVPASLTIRVDDYVVGGYVDAMSSSSSFSSEGNVQNASSIDVHSEYSNGSIPIYSQDGHLVVGLWYDWVNTQGTQVIFLAYHSEVYNSPIVTFVGQRYVTVNGTEVFIGNTLSLMEAYRDANGNNVPETSEISYLFIVNSSISFAVAPIQKIVLGEVAHYRWGVEYQTIDGFLIDENGISGARVIIEHISFSYDYYIQSNVSYTKTNFDIGKIVSLEPYEPNLTLQGLSLSLVYATMIITPKNYTVLVNEQPYNSTAAPLSPITTTRTEVRIENQKTYEFLFGENYTLHRDSLTEVYKSFSAASATNTVLSNARVSLSWLIEQLEGVLGEIFPKISTMQASINLDYMASTFVYRVCYPTWEGYRIRHDPTYVAYINPQGLPPNPPPPKSTPSVLITVTGLIALVAAVMGVIALIAAVLELRKTRHQFQPPNIHFTTLEC
jgi:hypothetical protein